MLLVFRLACLAAGLALLASLCWVLIAVSAAALQARRRQRALLALLAHGDPKVPGALVVDYPTAAAYCLPGLRSRIVVLSVGTLELLGRGELAAVLAHERAHLRERHDLVLLPFTALRRAFPRSAMCAEAHRAVALLVEMLADDRALRGAARPGNSCRRWCGSARQAPARRRRARWPPARATWPPGWPACCSPCARCPRPRARPCASPRACWSRRRSRCSSSERGAYQGPYGPELVPAPLLRNSLTLGRTSAR